MRRLGGAATCFHTRSEPHFERKRLRTLAYGCWIASLNKPRISCIKRALRRPPLDPNLRTTKATPLKFRTDSIPIPTPHPPPPAHGSSHGQHMAPPPQYTRRRAFKACVCRKRVIVSSSPILLKNRMVLAELGQKIAGALRSLATKTVIDQGRREAIALTALRLLAAHMHHAFPARIAGLT
jgi:hypothetical protein